MYTYNTRSSHTDHFEIQKGIQKKVYCNIVSLSFIVGVLCKYLHYKYKKGFRRKSIVIVSLSFVVGVLCKYLHYKTENVFFFFLKHFGFLKQSA